MTTTHTRWAALDIARALAVIGVVLNHAIDGMIGAELLDPVGKVAGVNEALYLFRMPALAFLLGIFIPRGVEKRGGSGYLRSRAYTVIWIYVLWTLLQGSIQVVLSAFTNGQTSFAKILTLWVPTAQFWFLPALLTMSFAVVLLRTWGRFAWMRVIILLVPAVVLWGSAPNIAGIHGFSLVVFVGAGAAVGLKGFARLSNLRPRVWILVASVATVIFLILIQYPLTPATTWVFPSLPTKLLSILAATTGICMVISVSMMLSRVPFVSGGLASIGQQTMPVYLMHILVLAGMRIFYARLGLAVPELFLAVAVPLAVIIPWLFGRNAKRFRLGWLFEPPRRNPRQPGAMPARAHLS